MKTCTRCSEEKPLEAFAVKSSAPSGRRARCKACEAELAKARREARAAEIQIPAEKKCGACGEVKPADAFHRLAGVGDGLRANCKACRVDGSRDYYLRNQDKIVEYQRVQGHIYYEANAPEIRKRARVARANNYPTLLEKLRQYRQTDIGRAVHMAATERRRARKMSADCGCVTGRTFEELRAIEKGLCAYCDGPGTSMDHVVALSRGGAHCLSNLRLACVPCNSSKNNRLVEEFTDRTITTVMECTK